MALHLHPDSTELGLRLDLFLAGRLGANSRARWKELIQRGLVQVDGRTAAPSMLLAARHQVTVDEIALKKESLVAAPELAAELAASGAILDTAGFPGLLAVNKPGGLPCHQNHADDAPCLANALAALRPGFGEAGPKALEGGLLNRLDTGTSGLVLAVDMIDARATWEEWLANGCFKDYLVLVQGDAGPLFAGGTTLETDWPVAHHRDRKDRAVAAGFEAAGNRASGPWRGAPRPAHTRWTILAAGQGASLLLARVRQAQFHQVRIHAAALGHPLVGDAIYAGPVEVGGAGSDCPLLFTAAPRHGLHAWRLVHLDGRSLVAPIPPDFAGAMAAFGISPSCADDIPFW